jgi:hypothetical protein
VRERKRSKTHLFEVDDKVDSDVKSDCEVAEQFVMRCDILRLFDLNDFLECSAFAEPIQADPGVAKGHFRVAGHHNLRWNVCMHMVCFLSEPLSDRLLISVTQSSP